MTFPLLFLFQFVLYVFLTGGAAAVVLWRRAVVCGGWEEGESTLNWFVSLFFSETSSPHQSLVPVKHHEDIGEFDVLF